MRFVAALLVSLITLSATAITAQAQDDAVELSSPLTTADDIISGQFDNGLSYLIRKNSKPENRAELRLVLKAGSILEDEKQQGFAHFVEHMAFNGTEDFEKQEIIDYVQSIGMQFGAHLNAYTSFDETVYMLQVPLGDPKTLETGIHILENWAHKISFEAEEIDAERGVVIEEWRLRLGAQGRIQAKQLPVILKDSRYAERLPIGTKETLESGSHEDLKRFYRDWYRPDMMTVIAVGDFEPEAVRGLIEQYFAPIPKAASPLDRPEYSIPDNSEPLVSIETDPELSNTRVDMLVKYDFRASKTVGDIRNRLVQNLYTGMLNRRISDLTLSGDVKWIDAGVNAGRYLADKAAFSLVAIPKTGEALPSIEVMMNEVQRVIEHGFNDQELMRQKAAILRNAETAAAEKDKTPSGALAGQLVQYVLSDIIVRDIEDRLAHTAALLPTIGLAEVNQMASHFMQGDNRIYTITGPDNEAETLPNPSALVGLWDQVQTKEFAKLVDDKAAETLVAETPTAGAIVDRSSDDELDVDIWTLSNGARVILKNTDFKNDEVLFSAFSDGGTSLLSDTEAIKTQVASSVIAYSGAGEFDNVTLNRFRQGKTFNVTPQITELGEGMQGAAKNADLESMLQLTYLYFMGPRNDQAAFDSWMGRVRPSIANRYQQPAAVFSEAIREARSGNDPRSQRIDTDWLDQQQLEPSYALFRDRFEGAADFTFVFVGNLDMSEMETLVTTWIGGLPAGRSAESYREMPDLRTTGAVDVRVEKGLDDKAQVSMLAFGTLDWSLRDSVVARATQSVLSDLLRERLREDKGGVYGVGVQIGLSRDPVKMYDITISFGCAPDRVDELVAEVQSILASMQDAPAEAKYIQTFQETARKSRETQLESNGFWLSWLQAKEQREGEILSFHDYIAEIDSVSGERVMEMAKTLFTTENWTTARLVPETKASE